MSPKVGSLADKANTKQAKGVDYVECVVLVIVNANTSASNDAVVIHPHYTPITINKLSKSGLLITNLAMMSSRRLIRATLLAVLVNIVFLETILCQTLKQAYSLRVIILVDS